MISHIGPECILITWNVVFHNGRRVGELACVIFVNDLL